MLYGEFMDKQKAIVKVEKSIAGGNQEISSKGLEKKNSYPQEVKAKQIKEINPSSYPPEVKSHSAENVVKADVPKEMKTTQLKEMRHDKLSQEIRSNKQTDVKQNKSLQEVKSNVTQKNQIPEMRHDQSAELGKRSYPKEFRTNKSKDVKSSNSEDIKQKSEYKDVRNRQTDNVERMDKKIILEFTCPNGLDPKEFRRQLKNQERGINRQTVYENMHNRMEYQSSGRSLEGNEVQRKTREKELAKRIKENQEKGMNYSKAKKEAENELKNKAVLHNPDQIAGGDPKNVSSRLGDASVNSSIGAQWRKNALTLDKEVKEYSKGKTTEELKSIKMNVKLEARNA